jgi:hypothetical protein
MTAHFSSARSLRIIVDGGTSALNSLVDYLNSSIRVWNQIGCIAGIVACRQNKADLRKRQVWLAPRQPEVDLDEHLKWSK